MTMKWNGDEFEARLRRGAYRGVVVGIGIVEQRAVDLVTNGPKTGAIYRRRGVAHQASAPGEPPANWTGTLLRSRTIDPFPEQVLAKLTFRTGYALALEIGTRHMDARSYARRALAETKEDVRAAIIAEARAELQ